MRFGILILHSSAGLPLWGKCKGILNLMPLLSSLQEPEREIFLASLKTTLYMSFYGFMKWQHHIQSYSVLALRSRASSYAILR